MTTIFSSPARLSVLSQAAPGTLSTLEITARDMALGSYVEVAGLQNTKVMTDDVPGGVGHIISYSDKLAWDPVGRKIYFMSSDDPGNGRKAVAYDLGSNSFQRIPAPFDLPPGQVGVSHVYGGHDFDKVRRRWWYTSAVGNVIGYYSATDNAWVSVPTGWGTQQAVATSLAYFPARNSLVVLRDKVLWERSDNSGAWTVLASSIRSSYHSVCHHNITHNCIVFGGGNDTPLALYRLDSSGKVTAYDTVPPFNIECPRVEFVEDPSTGDFVVYFHRSQSTARYSFNPTSGTWTNLGTTGVPADVFSLGIYGGNLGMVATVVPEQGVQVFLSHADSSGDFHLYLYKYAQIP